MHPYSEGHGRLVQVKPYAHIQLSEGVQTTIVYIRCLSLCLACMYIFHHIVCTHTSYVMKYF